MESAAVWSDLSGPEETLTLLASQLSQYDAMTSFLLRRGGREGMLQCRDEMEGFEFDMGNHNPCELYD